LNAEQPFHFIVEDGPETGRRIGVPPGGARIGRSSKNDITLNDGSLSRFHCRAFFKNGALWISDLASTNETLLNHKPVQESALQIGDRVEIGETIMKVIHNGNGDATAPAATAPVAQDIMSKPAQETDIDLGLAAATPKQPREHARSHRLIFVALGMAVLVLIILLLKWFMNSDSTRPVVLTANERPAFSIQYEKEQADADNIFRYALTVADNNISVQIDNLENGRHISREQAVDPELLNKIAAEIEHMGFFDLRDSYEGLSPDVWDAWDMTVTIGSKTHRVHVRNCLEPPQFQTIRELVEEFTQNELGLAALSLPPAELLKLARAATLQGRKMYDERDVGYENLFLSICSFKEAKLYLETIEPKPDYYPDVITGLTDSEEVLQKRYDDNLFRVQRAIQLRDWPTAAQHLRIICEIIPARTDERHKKAQTKLLDVERRIEK